MLSMQWSSGKNNFITEKVRSSSVGMIRFLVYSLEVLNINFLSVVVRCSFLMLLGSPWSR